MEDFKNHIENHSLDELSAKHGILFKFSSDKRKVSINYNHIESDKNDTFSNMCRGLILRKEDKSPFSQNEKIGKFVILCRSFDRFFNYGENQENSKPINWKESILFEKIDGTLINLYWDDIQNAWAVSTKKIPDADLPLGDENTDTFRDLFIKSLEIVGKVNFDYFCTKLNKNVTYIFELITPFNRIVVDYNNQYMVYLIGARNNLSGQEYDVLSDEFDALNIDRPKTYKMNDVKNIIDYVNGKEATELEGIVACDPNFNRLKIKNAKHIVFNIMKDRLLSRKESYLEIILLESDDDFEPIFSQEQKSIILNLKNKLNKYCDHVSSDFLFKLNETSKLPDKDKRKHFAISLQKDKAWLALYMEMYAKNINNPLKVIQSKNVNGRIQRGTLDTLYSILQKI